MSVPADASVLEENKENIQPLPGGRPASRLSHALKTSSASHQAFKDQRQREREQFELALKESDNLDDPLQLYIDYINWTHTYFPQGANSESGLVILLERCISIFRDVFLYKNDPRYLKIWLEYTNYSDSPRDVYVYLAKKEIGNRLSLYYEEFAKFLESKGKFNDACQIYELGIQYNAFPLSRLQRSYEKFRARVDSGINQVQTTTIVRDALAVKQGSVARFGGEDNEQPRKKSKLEVFKDNTENPTVLQSIFGIGVDDQNLQLGSAKSRVKENTIAAKQWTGEVLKQKTTPPSTSSTKFQVFKDENPQEPETKITVVFDKQDLAASLIETKGKKPERVLINMDLVYQNDQEYSLPELLALSRKRKDPEFTQTLMNPLKGINVTNPEPTITMYSKMANNEVMSMFNSNRDFEEGEEQLHDNTTTQNFDGFVTETIDVQPVLQPHTTPPTDKEDYADTPSSPFVDEPIVSQKVIINPFDKETRDLYLDNLSIPLTVFAGFFDKTNISSNSLGKFKSITHDNKKIAKSSQQAIIDYCGDEIYCLIHELGQGGYGLVYLIETASTGELKALKIESPASRWEFYILHQIHRRLLGFPPRLSSQFVQAESLFYFNDESFLIMDYYSQSTLLDVVNYYKSSNLPIEESLVIYFAIELLKALETLHSIGILHGDLKADNCMVHFENIEESEWSEYYTSDGSNGWDKKGITLIDFGRGVDLKLFPKDAMFSCVNLKVDQQDCPAMHKGEPWSYEVDYYGLASIIHTLLFGNYIKIRHNGTKVQLEATFRRYWQSQLWSGLFDLLLNPYSVNEPRHPKIMELKQQREMFENWLISNSRPKGLKRVISSLEKELNSINNKRVS
ncbi:uncharacterized protein SPAPADRAFT_133075 [Spathaspora passalidarum NRRL Y-27907]|uniref:Uncharacterized protein n=1 Tax=Spathaspora passalidarum (strain NRRL Y-27907 / 11-Y1) TaxID=619300 RepID=G3AH24_SPAPN|nr:uncharacterized protein SPAPADRAFT_133075 [Spathaspora passalidarum NRRL Y-27907]EGW35454.1 hypothetical protein SPAPADRAFT_133075 [Spathaspora passalidarum NRRL Y-27907]